MAASDQDKAMANELSRQIIGAAIEVHRRLGPGLLESAYQACLARELELQHIDFVPQVYMPLEYKGLLVEKAYRLDLFVAGSVVVEIKSIEKIDLIHEAQLLTYLRLTERWLGLLINFNVPVLKDGIKRMVLG
jgi:GxxExxY protein